MKLDNIYYVLIGILAIVLCFVEGFVLSRFGLLYTTQTFIGVSVIAFCVCVIALQPDVVVSADEVYYQDETANPNGISYVDSHLPLYFKCVYYLLQPVSVGLMTIAAYISVGFFTTLQNWISVIDFVVCLGLAVLFGFLTDIRLKRKLKNKQKIDT